MRTVRCDFCANTIVGDFVVVKGYRSHSNTDDSDGRVTTGGVEAKFDCCTECWKELAEKGITE